VLILLTAHPWRRANLCNSHKRFDACIWNSTAETVLKRKQLQDSFSGGIGGAQGGVHRLAIDGGHSLLQSFQSRHLRPQSFIEIPKPGWIGSRITIGIDHGVAGILYRRLILNQESLHSVHVAIAREAGREIQQDRGDRDVTFGLLNRVGQL